MNTRFAAALLLSCTLASTSVLAQSRGSDRNDQYRSQEQSQRKDRNQEQNRRGDERSQTQRQDTRHDRREERHERRDDRRDYRNDRRDERSDRRDDRGHYGASRFHKGERLPAYYRDHVFVVDHWQAHKLQRPPRGHQWVQIGGDYVLVAITTGIIASIILNH